MKETEEMKKCTKCGKNKSVSEFYSNKNSKDGLRAECKECKKEATQKWRKANPEKVAANNKKWNEKRKSAMKSAIIDS